MPLHDDTQLYLVNSVEEAYNFKRWLGEKRDFLGVDTETSGFDPYASDAKLRLVQFGDERTGWAIPWERWGGVALEALNDYTGQIGFHNVRFDAPWLEVHAGFKMPWHRTDDTFVMASIERPGGANDLKTLSDRFVDPMASQGQKNLKDTMKRNNWTFATIPVDHPDYWFYSALDPVLNAHIRNHFRTDQSNPSVYDLEMGVRRVCSRMEANGMRVDLDYSQVKFKEMTEYVEQSKEWAEKNWGINIGSGPQLADFFVNRLGVSTDPKAKGVDKFTKIGDSGVPSVDKDQMALLSTSENKMISDTAKFILKIRKVEKMSNSYFKNFLEMNTDGLVHPTIKTMGARTGRMSVTDPALQTIPRGDAVVRDAFVPVREGESLLSCDYSQVEMRLLAHFSRDPKLQEAFKEADATGGDFFVTLGKDIYSDPNFDKKDARRGLVKGTMYGSAYGSGIQKMAETAGVTYAQMEVVSKAVFEAYPGIKSFMKETEKLGSAREKAEGIGYILTQMGRRLPCDEGKVYALTNYMLQGTAAELMKQAIVKLDAAGYTDAMCVPIHDEMIFSVPAEDAAEVRHDVQEIMSYCEGQFAVDLPAEAEEPMDRWGSKYRKKGEVFGYDASQL